MKNVLLIIVTLYLSPILVNAQKYWTLEECIKYALDNNIQIKRQELQSHISKNEYKLSKTRILPDLNAGATHDWRFGRNVDRFTNEITNTTVMTDNFYISSTLTLFSGFQIRNTIEQNQYILQRSFQEFERAKNDISLQVATVFLQILFNEEALAIAESQLEVTSLQLEKTRKLVDVGNKAKGELLQIQAQEANEKYNLINAKNNLKISYLTLAQLLELNNAEDFRIKLPDSVAFDFKNILASVDEIYKDGESRLPQIKSAEYDQNISQKSLEVARGQLYPRLYLTGTYGTGYSDAREQIVGLNPVSDTIGFANGVPVVNNTYSPQTGKYPFSSQLKDNQYKSLSFRLEIPFFNHLQARSNISTSRIRLKDAVYNLEQTRKNLYKEIQKAHADAIAALERYNSATEAVVFNEESFKYTQQKFDVGMVSSVDYNVAKGDLTKAKSDLIQAKYEYIFKVKVLDFYRGIPITLN